MTLLTKFCLYCNETLYKNKEARSYLSSRGISLKSTHKFLLGYDDDNFIFGLSEIERSELLLSKLVQFKDTNKVYDKFMNRIVFPVMKDKDILSITSRSLSDKGTKHLHLNGSFLVPYNVDTVGSKDVLYIVESPLDCIIMEQEGFSAISVFGTNGFKEKYVGFLKDYTGAIVWLFDTDNNKAGLTGSLKNAQLLLDSVNKDSYISTLPLIKGLNKTDINMLYLRDKAGFSNIIKGVTKAAVLYTETDYHKEELEKKKVKILRKAKTVDTGNRLEAIKAFKLVDIISLYIPVTKTSFGGITFCPFHKDEKSKSLGLYNNSGYFMCFSGACGEKGDAVQFVKKLFNLSFLEAMKKIENDLGINKERRQHTKKEN